MSKLCCKKLKLWHKSFLYHNYDFNVSVNVINPGDCGGMNVFDLVCLFSVVWLRKHGFTLAVFDPSLLQIKLPFGLEVKPLLLVFWTAEEHVNTLLCCSYAVRGPEPLTCHVSDGFPAVFFGFGNDRQEVATPALQRFALDRVWGEERGAQRAQEPCAQNRPVSEGVMEWCVFLVSWCRTYRVIVGHSARLDAHFYQIVQPLGLPVAHAHTHGFSRSSVTRSCRNNSIKLEQTGWGKAFHTVEF